MKSYTHIVEIGSQINRNGAGEIYNIFGNFCLKKLNRAYQQTMTSTFIGVVFCVDGTCVQF